MLLLLGIDESVVVTEAIISGPPMYMMCITIYNQQWEWHVCCCTETLVDSSMLVPINDNISVSEC